jgi:riboflavin biosynthesis pyrimidine reductase
MQTRVIRLYPADGEAVEHRGLYLRQDLHSMLKSDDSTFVYANFITSLDGRIAVPDREGHGVELATQITNPRDWRLFQELAVQSDVLITSGRYLRGYEQGPKQELLQVYDDPEFSDLGHWRQEQGLSDYPAVAVISRSLDFDVPAPLQEEERELFVFTTEEADDTRKQILADQGANIVIAGTDDVMGSSLATSLRDYGHRLIYSTAGPRIFHMLLSSGVLDRLYLTIAQRILGGKPFSSINEGSLLDPPAAFKISSLYYDPLALDGNGQFYAAFDHQET